MLHVAPLVEQVQGDGEFYVFTASQKDVRLLHGTRHGLKEIELETLPRSLAEALIIDEYVQSLQFHTSGRGRDSIDQGGGMYHGQAGGDQGEETGCRLVL